MTGGGGHTVLRRGQRLGSAPALNVNVCAVMFRHLCLVSQPDGLDAPLHHAEPREASQGGAGQEKRGARSISSFSGEKQLVH